MTDLMLPHDNQVLWDTVAITVCLLVTCMVIGLFERDDARAKYWRRLRTMTVLIVVFLASSYIGGSLFIAVVTMIALAAVWELWNIGERTNERLMALVFMCMIATLPAATGTMGTTGLFTLGTIISMLAVLSALVPMQAVSSEPPFSLLLGVFYIGVPTALMVLIQHDGGFGAMVFYLAVVQLADLGAFLGGRRWGRHQLAPQLSPGKTWEGLVAGAICAGLGAMAFGYAVPGWSRSELLLIGLILTAVGLLGDLFASCLKRLRGLKDFGSLLPGHGGVIDRFDSYLFCAPVAWWLFASPNSHNSITAGRMFDSAQLPFALTVTVILVAFGIWFMNRMIERRQQSP